MGLWRVQDLDVINENVTSICIHLPAKLQVRGRSMTKGGWVKVKNQLMNNNQGWSKTKLRVG